MNPARIIAVLVFALCATTLSGQPKVTSQPTDGVHRCWDDFHPSPRVGGVSYGCVGPTLVRAPGFEPTDITSDSETGDWGRAEFLEITYTCTPKSA